MPRPDGETGSPGLVIRQHRKSSYLANCYMQGRSLWAQADYSLPKSVSHSPLIFGKLYCRFFVMDIVAFMLGGMFNLV